MKNEAIDSLKNTSVIIAYHEYATGPPHSLESFCKHITNQLLIISHPFVFAKEKRSHTRFYKNGKLTRTLFFPVIFGNQILSTVKDILLTFSWVISHGKHDMYIGVDGVNALVGIILRRIGFVRHVIYYVIDYVPNRFPQKLLNTIYHWIDQCAVKGSDVVWNLSDIMVEMREHGGLSTKFRDKQIIVPVGTDDGITKLSKKIFKRFNVVHMGHLTEKQGVQLLITSIPSVIKKVPEFHVDIFGGGEYEKQLKDLVFQMNVQKYITFFGYINNHNSLLTLLSERAIGIAPYTDTTDNFIRYTDPGKVKAYLSAGLPVIITQVPPVWKEIEKYSCGTACKSTPEDLASAITTLLLDDKKLYDFRINAFNFGKKFRWNTIFTDAFMQSFQRFT